MEGIVTTVQSVLCTVDTEAGTYQCQARRRLVDTDSAESKPLAVGDRVIVTPIDDEQAVIEEVLPRTTRLSRRSPRDLRTEQVIVANVDQVLIVAAIRKPDISPGLIDRYIIAAEAGGIVPIVCLNKIDLAEDSAEFMEPAEMYAGMDYDVVLTSAETGDGIQDLADLLREKTTVFAGHSGVGKSSLLNALQPNLRLRTGEVYESGRHTTTWASLLKLDIGGYVVDTPGIREFTLFDIEPHEVQQFFPEIWELSHDCHMPDCTHIHEPECAVLEAVESGDLLESRYESYFRIVATTETENIPRQTDVDNPDEQITKKKRKVSRRKRKQDMRRLAERYLSMPEDDEEEEDMW